MQSTRGFEYGVHHIISPSTGTISDVLLSTLQLSSADVEFLLDLGSVYLNHQRLKEDSSVLVQPGDYLRVHSKPRRFPFNDDQWISRLLFANEHFVVVDKPSGLPVHASVDNRKENVLAYLSEALQCELFITHRLDVPTQGLIVYAKTLEFQKAFNILLIQREVEKIYSARVEGLYSHTGLLRHFMEPSPRAPKKVSREQRENWQECLLEILDSHLDETGTQTQLRIRLHTGRTHQIRAQLGHEGHPIVGDSAYGACKTDNRNPSDTDKEKIALCSAQLSFIDPLSGVSYEFKSRLTP
ncbi:MAG: RluA family pseudouridine synthase [Bdellovibrio sp.]